MNRQLKLVKDSPQKMNQVQKQKLLGGGNGSYVLVKIPDNITTDKGVARHFARVYRIDIDLTESTDIGWGGMYWNEDMRSWMGYYEGISSKGLARLFLMPRYYSQARPERYAKMSDRMYFTSG